MVPPMDQLESIRTRLRSRRMEMDVSQKWLSAAADVNQNYVQQLEKGYGPLATLAALMRLADAMGVRFCWLITGVGLKYLPAPK